MFLLPSTDQKKRLASHLVFSVVWVVSLPRKCPASLQQSVARLQSKEEAVIHSNCFCIIYRKLNALTEDLESKSVGGIFRFKIPQDGLFGFSAYLYHNSNFEIAIYF